MFLSRGDRDLGVAFQTHPGRQAFISSGSKETRSALESRRVGNTLKKGVATYSGILAWRVPWIEEPGGLQCKESQRVRHDEHFHVVLEITL